MLQAESDNTIASAKVTRGLIGHWVVDMGATGRDHAVSEGLEPSAIDAASQTLVLLWSCHSKSTDSDAPDVYARPCLTAKADACGPIGSAMEMRSL